MRQRSAWALLLFIVSAVITRHGSFGFAAAFQQGGAFGRGTARRVSSAVDVADIVGMEHFPTTTARSFRWTGTAARRSRMPRGLSEGDDVDGNVPLNDETRLQSGRAETPATPAPRAKKSAAATVACPDCDLCDGSGRIAGGLGAVLPWLPVKAYRPCPNFIDRGGTYQRSGQGLDEIAFGRDSTYTPQ